MIPGILARNYIVLLKLQNCLLGLSIVPNVRHSHFLLLYLQNLLLENSIVQILFC